MSYHEIRPPASLAVSETAEFERDLGRARSLAKLECLRADARVRTNECRRVKNLAAAREWSQATRALDIAIGMYNLPTYYGLQSTRAKDRRTLRNDRQYQEERAYKTAVGTHQHAFQYEQEVDRASREAVTGHSGAW